MRYERKFVTSGMSHEACRMLLSRHAALFVEHHPPRIVNNMYFDTQGLAHYRDHVDGAARRCKVRVRWYGDVQSTVARPVLELKHKVELVGFKTQVPIAEFVMDQDCLPAEVLASACNDLPSTSLMRRYASGLRPILLNSYHRRYYLSSDGRFRMTLDTHLGFQRLGRRLIRVRPREIPLQMVIFELKYDRAHDEDANRIATQLPLYVTKLSKYVTGVEWLYR
jgi:hypothetical protein